MKQLLEREAHNSPYPTEAFENLYSFLKDKSEKSQRKESENEALHEVNNPLVVVHTFYDQSEERKAYKGDAASRTVFEALQKPSDGPQLIFMRGYPDHRWLNLVFDKYKVDPHLFYRHMMSLPQYAPETMYLTKPILHFRMPRVLSLRIVTIMQNLNDTGARLSKEELAAKRSRAREDMADYQAKLQTNGKPGDSVVRRFDYLNDNFCVMEQEITVGIVVDSPPPRAEASSPTKPTVNWRGQCSPSLPSCAIDTNERSSSRDLHRQFVQIQSQHTGAVERDL